MHEEQRVHTNEVKVIIESIPMHEYSTYVRDREHVRWIRRAGNGDDTTGSFDDSPNPLLIMSI